MQYDFNAINQCLIKMADDNQPWYQRNLGETISSGLNAAKGAIQDFQRSTKAQDAKAQEQRINYQRQDNSPSFAQRVANGEIGLNTPISQWGGPSTAQAKQAPQQPALDNNPNNYQEDARMNARPAAQPPKTQPQVQNKPVEQQQQTQAPAQRTVTPAGNGAVEAKQPAQAPAQPAQPAPAQGQAQPAQAPQGQAQPAQAQTGPRLTNWTQQDSQNFDRAMGAANAINNGGYLNYRRQQRAQQAQQPAQNKTASIWKVAEDEMPNFANSRDYAKYQPMEGGYKGVSHSGENVANWRMRAANADMFNGGNRDEHGDIANLKDKTGVKPFKNSTGNQTDLRGFNPGK